MKIFRVAAEEVRKELIQLPTQDLTWVARSPYGHNKYWIDVHTTLTQWYRPNPLCCTEHQHSHLDDMGTSPSPATPLSTTYPEHVIALQLQCYVPAPTTDQSPNDDHGREEQLLPPPLNMKLSMLFIPHDTPDPEEEDDDGEKHGGSYGHHHQSRALEVIDEEERDGGACQLQDVDERLLPRAMDRLRRNAASRTYQVCLTSGHGAAHICVEKTSPSTASASGRRRRRIRRSSTGGAAAAARSAARSSVGTRQGETAEKRRERYSIEGWRESARQLLKLWVVRSSEKLRGSVSSWTTEHYYKNTP